MKFNKTIFSILVASGLTLSLSSCKKDKDSDATGSDLANVTITVVTDDDNDPVTPNVPVEDAVIAIVPIVFDILEDVEEKDKQTDADGKFTYTGLLKGDYIIGADDGNISGNKGAQLLPGDNEVTVIVN